MSGTEQSQRLVASPGTSEIAPDINTAYIRDHEKNAITLAWPKSEACANQSIPPFGYQVYILSPLSPAHYPSDTEANTAALPTNLVNLIHDLGGLSDASSKYHFGIHQHAHPNIPSILAHQRREIAHRNASKSWPQMVDRWSDDPLNPYRNFVIVLETAALSVWPPEAITTVDFDLLSDLTHEGDVHPLVVARRETDLRQLAEQGLLWERWRQAGHDWTAEDLRYRNDGGEVPWFPGAESESGSEHGDARVSADEPREGVGRAALEAGVFATATEAKELVGVDVMDMDTSVGENEALL